MYKTTLNVNGTHRGDRNELCKMDQTRAIFLNFHYYYYKNTNKNKNGNKKLKNI